MSVTSAKGVYDLATEKVVSKDAVVLDLNAVDPIYPRWGVVEHVVAALRYAAKGDRTYSRRVMGDLADQIAAQKKPPRIPEPGWGAIVEAGVDAHDERLLWTPNDQGFWSCKNPDEYARHWQQLLDPVLVRDGIEDES